MKRVKKNANGPIYLRVPEPVVFVKVVVALPKSDIAELDRHAAQYEMRRADVVVSMMRDGLAGTRYREESQARRAQRRSEKDAGRKIEGG